MTNEYTICADWQAKHLIDILQSIPAQSFIGDLPVKVKVGDPAPTFLLYSRLRYAIEKKFLNQMLC